MALTPLGFDNILESPAVLKDSIAVSASGEYSISSSPGRGTFLEHKVEGGGKGVRLFPFTADVAGFYGRDVTLIAIAHEDTLRIVNLHKMEVVSTVKIRPGGVFVPRSGNSGFIGVVSPHGAAYIIEDNGDTYSTPLTVGEEYEVLWSSQAQPVGYTWNDDVAAYIYIRSTPEDEGATISSTQGMNLFTVWKNDAQNRSEVYITTYDEPHILKRVYSFEGKAVVEKIVELPQGSILDNVVLFGSGRPALAVGFNQGRSIAEIIPPEKNLSPILYRLVTNEEKSITATCMGVSSYISWTQTPITPAVPSVTNYSIPGRPRYEIHGGKPQYTELKTGAEVSFTIPRTNVARSIPIKNNPHSHVYYRWVSPLPEVGYTAETAVVIVDKEGLVSAGEYSPTVKMLYDLNIPVAIIPVIGVDDDVLDDVAMDIIDVSHDIINGALAKNVCVLSEGEMNQSAFKSLTMRKSPVRNVLAYHCKPEYITKKVAKKHATTVICDNEEEADKFSVDTPVRVIGEGRQKEIDLIDIVTKAM